MDAAQELIVMMKLAEGEEQKKKEIEKGPFPKRDNAGLYYGVDENGVRDHGNPDMRSGYDTAGVLGDLYSSDAFSRKYMGGVQDPDVIGQRAEMQAQANRMYEISKQLDPTAYNYTEEFRFPNRSIQKQIDYAGSGVTNKGDDLLRMRGVLPKKSPLQKLTK